VIAPNGVDPDLVDGKALLGCRLPTLIVSPLARGNPEKPRVSALLFDHTSVLKMIEWRWNLEPLTARDGSNEISNLALALDFANPDTSIPELPAIADPPMQPCSTHSTAAASGADNEAFDFDRLQRSELSRGWPIPESMRQ
jgi:phospholipase C